GCRASGAVASPWDALKTGTNVDYSGRPGILPHTPERLFSFVLSWDRLISGGGQATRLLRTSSSPWRANMILTEQQKQQVIEFLKKRVGNTSCPECQNADLKIGDRLTALCTMTEENKAHP